MKFLICPKHKTLKKEKENEAKIFLDLILILYNQ